LRTRFFKHTPAVLSFLDQHPRFHQHLHTIRLSPPTSPRARRRLSRSPRAFSASPPRTSSSGRGTRPHALGQRHALPAPRARGQCAAEEEQRAPFVALAAEVQKERSSRGGASFSVDRACARRRTRRSGGRMR
jgi:hypothetical protein